jgi:hypothetical protein
VIWVVEGNETGIGMSTLGEIENWILIGEYRECNKMHGIYYLDFKSLCLAFKSLC